SRALSPLPSFPTRRSSDLVYVVRAVPLNRDVVAAIDLERGLERQVRVVAASGTPDAQPLHRDTRVALQENVRRVWSGCVVQRPRSEEHTSELQSRENLVCR